jgi:hypothetical protein
VQLLLRGYRSEEVQFVVQQRLDDVDALPNLQVAQLIEENAMLRKEKLISDMLHGPSKH